MAGGDGNVSEAGDTGAACVQEALLHHSTFLEPDIKRGTPAAVARPLVLVVLNTRLPSAAFMLWRRASATVCADGGSNWVYDDLPALAVATGAYTSDADARNALLPSAIVGDLDSIRPEVRAFYTAHGVPVIDRSQDQDTTDFMKALDLLEGKLPAGSDLTSDAAEGPWLPVAPPGADIVVLSCVGCGRLDHDLATLSTLHERPHLRLALLGAGTIARCLPANQRSTIRLTAAEGPQCGLIPLAGATRGTVTTGLKYNLSGQVMCMGGLVSACNTATAAEVTVVGHDAPLLWTTTVDEMLLVPQEPCAV